MDRAVSDKIGQKKITSENKIIVPAAVSTKMMDAASKSMESQINYSSENERESAGMAESSDIGLIWFNSW